MAKAIASERYHVFEMGIRDRKKPSRQVNRHALSLEAAKSLARIGATEGKHDRAVTTSPKSRSFEIVAVYEAGTGQNITQAFRANKLPARSLKAGSRVQRTAATPRVESPPSQYATPTAEEWRYDPMTGAYIERDRAQPAPEPEFEYESEAPTGPD